MQTKTPSINVPQYNPPTPMNFNSPWGNTNFANNTFTYTPSQSMMDQFNGINNLQSQIAGQIGATPQQQLANQNQWQQAFMQAATQNTLPSLYNTMYNQGLGGSSVYGSSMANLLGNLGTQSVLNAQNMNNSNQQNLQQWYNQLQGTQGANMNYGLGQQQLAAQNYASQNQTAANVYKDQLPYLYAQQNQAQAPSAWKNFATGALQGGLINAGIGGFASLLPSGMQGGGGSDVNAGYGMPSGGVYNGGLSNLSMNGSGSGWSGSLFNNIG